MLLAETTSFFKCKMFMFILQEEIYDLILQANKECLKLCKPGANLLDIHHFSVRLQTWKYALYSLQ